VLAAVPDVDPLEDTRAEAEQLLEDARAEADTIAAEARGHAARTVAAANAEASRIRETARAEADRKEERSKNLDVWMGRAVIAGAVGLTASGEYSLARLAHFPASVAWLLPFVIDIYVIQAFRRHRDIVQAIFLTIAANVVYHLAAAGMFGVTTDARGEHHATWWLIALVASIASIILWRMHVITAPPKPRRGVRESTRTDDRGPSHVSAPVSGDSAGGSADESSRERADERARERTGETSHGGTGERAYGAPRESAESPAKPSHPAPRERARSGSHRRTQKRRESAPATRTPESEVDALVALMRKRGNADAVTLTDAKKAAAGRSEATAARRLAAARTEYAKLSGGTP
jgi:hypothetical protein